jgi:hypothetical protein
MVVSFDTVTGGVAANAFEAISNAAHASSQTGRPVQPFIQSLLNISSLQNAAFRRVMLKSIQPSGLDP